MKLALERHLHPATERLTSRVSVRNAENYVQLVVHELVSFVFFFNF